MIKNSPIPFKRYSDNAREFNTLMAEKIHGGLEKQFRKNLKDAGLKGKELEEKLEWLQNYSNNTLMVARAVKEYAQTIDNEITNNHYPVSPNDVLDLLSGGRVITYVEDGKSHQITNDDLQNNPERVCSYYAYEYESHMVFRKEYLKKVA